MSITQVLLLLPIAYSTLGMNANAPVELLDQHIYDELSEPTELIGRGDLVLKELISYYCNMLDVYNYLKWKNKKGLKMVEVLEKDGGPRLPKLQVNEATIKAAYKWEDKDFEVLTTMLGSIKNLWSKVTDKIYQFSDTEGIPYQF